MNRRHESPRLTGDRERVSKGETRDDSAGRLGGTARRDGPAGRLGGTARRDGPAGQLSGKSTWLATIDIYEHVDRQH